MHYEYNPTSCVDWDSIFDEQARQSGSNGFRGFPYQRGSSGLGGLFSKFFSLILPIAKEASKSIASQALSTSGQIVNDWASGRNFKDSFREHGSSGYNNLVNRAINKIGSQSGQGSLKRRRRIRKNTITRRKSVSSKKVPKICKAVNKPKSRKKKPKSTTNKKRKTTKVNKRKTPQYKDIFGKWGN